VLTTEIPGIFSIKKPSMSNKMIHYQKKGFTFLNVQSYKNVWVNTTSLNLITYYILSAIEHFDPSKIEGVKIAITINTTNPKTNNY